MQFKNDDIRCQWRKKGKIVDDHGKSLLIRLNPILIETLMILELTAGVSRHGPQMGIFITDLISTFRDGFSLHPYGYAADIRITDWMPLFRASVKAIGLALRNTNSAIQFVWEENEPPDNKNWTGPHLHVEYDDAKIKAEIMQSYNNGETYWK